MKDKPLNIDECPYNREWLHSRWNLPPYKSEAFVKELKQLGLTLSEFKLTAMYERAVEEGKIVDDKWMPAKDGK